MTPEPKEPALRRLDKGLPRLDMMRRKPAPARPSSPPPETAQGLMREARRMFAEARADRQEAAELLAEAHLHAATLIAEAEAALPVTPVPRLPRIADIQRAVAERHGLSMRALLGAGKSRDIVNARREAVALCAAARPDLSAAALGRLFGGRDHSFVLHALKGARP